MKYYVLQVKTREEGKYIRKFAEQYGELPVKLYFLKRKLIEKRGGKTETETRPLFPGYIFLETGEEDEADVKLYLNVCRKVNGFVRFLPARSPVRLTGRDLELVLHLINAADGRGMLGLSKVRFDENDKIVVVEGAAEGFEGNIVKVDRRKGRIKVRLDLCRNSFTVDLGFEAVRKLS